MEDEEEEEEEGEEEGGAAAVAKEKEEAAETSIEDVFVIYGDGRLISHRTRRLTPDMDSDIVGGMLTAIQQFVKDSFSKEEDGALASMEYGSNKILLVHGENIILAMVIQGVEDPNLRKRMKKVAADIELKFAKELESWTGRTDKLKGINKLLKPLIVLPGKKAKDVEDFLNINVLSLVEFWKGYVRVKVAVLNDSKSVITDTSLRLVYDQDALRLSHIEPELELVGTEAKFGNINPDEKKTVSFYLDPLICLKSNIDATATFRDARGKLKSAVMDQQKVEVVCPVLYTDEEINIAMLKRIVGELNVHDSKIFNLNKIPAQKAMQVARAVVKNYKINEVRVFEEEKPSYSAEAWYYGISKFSKEKMVIRISVSEATRILEFAVSSEDLPAITGLLADIRHEYIRTIKEKGLTKDRLKSITDPVERDRILRKSELLIHKYTSAEAEAEAKPDESESK
jgi:hypothetical protein